MSDSTKLLIICGPTGTGKTALAVYLAKQFNAELVSADSRQVYRGMDIGTGKDRDVVERSGISIHLLDVVDPDNEFSVSHFARFAHAAIKDIRLKGKLPIVVGGTGLYVQSIINPIETASIPPDPALRKRLSAMSRVELQKKVQHEIPDVWALMNTSDKNNPRRLIRKLEIGQKISGPGDKIFHTIDYCMIGLKAPNEELYKRIDLRVDSRVEEGIIQEITQLLHKGYSWDLHSMSALGYREWKPYFEATKDKQLLKDEIIQKWKYDEHAYARRQMTWFRRQKGIKWFDILVSGYEHQVTAYVSKWYTKSGL